MFDLYFSEPPQFIAGEVQIEQIVSELIWIANNDGENLVITMLHYTIEYNDFNMGNLIKLTSDHFPGNLTEKVMSLGERLRQEGMEKGLQQGVQQGMEQGMQQGIEKEKNEIAMKLIEKGCDLSLVYEVTGLPMLDLEKLINEPQ